VITGAGRGIGAAIAKTLALQGAKLTLMGRTAAALEAQAAALQDSAEVQTLAMDVTLPDWVEKAFRQSVAAMGPVDILVNNAGAAVSAPFGKTSLPLWQEMLAVNLTGAYLCCSQVLPEMIRRGTGRIVNIASTAGLTGYAYVSAYCAAKHGVIGLTRALALETARTGVTVNAVCPGYTETGIVRDAVANIVAKTGRNEADARAALTANNPQGRMIQPGEIAATVLWLCTPGSESVTGQSIAVCGGELM
jgi:NAD(P)-dependent dehydrogenase (short-subunit alcohol dehydrogenase family)